MRIYNRYIITLTISLTLTTAIISVFRKSLDFYFSAYLVECLAITLLFTYLSPRAQKALNRVWYVLFAGFVILVMVKAVEIILGIKIL